MGGGLDFPGLAQWLTALGGPGVIIGFLLWERSGLQKKLEASQAAHMADIRKYSSDIAASLATATNVISANTSGNDRMSSTINRLAEAVTAVSMRLEGVEDSVDKLDQRRARG
jgi:hypothetical protein